MQYGLHATIQHLRSEVSECSAEIQELSAKVVEQEQELSAMKRKVEKAREELSDTRHALKDTITKLQLAQKQRDCALNQTLNSVHFEDIGKKIMNFLSWLPLFGRNVVEML